MEEYTILASDPDFGTVSVCPGGVVHVTLQHLSLKFVPADFAKFSDLISKARLKFGNHALQIECKPRLHVVPRESQEDTPPAEPNE